jgi:lipopolysaccharide transport system ATP-binding protein
MIPQIEVRGLGKAYTIGHDVVSYRALRDELASVVAHPIRGLRGRHRKTEQMWALKEVSFDVEPGDVVGIVGRNGSGKSTLLKVLSRIVTPTEGTATMRGRVSSLLEVGTGFHPELTGRENVFLNGALLGMPRRQINARFDEIVEFSEVERFLDTPVKFYSSGMYVRLAFAVAAHLDPDVLIVDEVLAVGDAAFQQKSLGKMNSVARDGRTVLFVSHNSQSVFALCRSGLHLSGGRILAAGPIHDVMASYRAELAEQGGTVAERTRLRSSSGGATVITRVVVRDESGQARDVFEASEPVVFELDVDVELRYRGSQLSVAFAVNTETGTRVFTAASSWVGVQVIPTTEQLSVRCVIDEPRLAAGRFIVSASISSGGETLDSADKMTAFEIAPSRQLVDPAREPHHGPVEVPCRFELIEAKAPLGAKSK